MGSWVWIAIVVTALVGILGVALILAKRPVDVDDLGRVTAHWIAQNHDHSR